MADKDWKSVMDRPFDAGSQSELLELVKENLIPDEPTQICKRCELCKELGIYDTLDQLLQLRTLELAVEVPEPAKVLEFKRVQ